MTSTDLRSSLCSVVEASPAWQCGLRTGDNILMINEWQISVMDRPEVALHLFQAGANQVKLGILRGNTATNADNHIGVF